MTDNTDIIFPGSLPYKTCQVTPVSHSCTASFIPEDTQTIQQDDSLFDKDTQYKSIVSSQRWSEPPETAPETCAIMPCLKLLELMSVPGISQGSNTQDKCHHEEVDYSHKLCWDLYEKHRVINQLRGHVRQLKEQEAVLHNIDDCYQMACVEIKNQKRKVMELQGIMERCEEEHSNTQACIQSQHEATINQCRTNIESICNEMKRALSRTQVHMEAQLAKLPALSQMKLAEALKECDLKFAEKLKECDKAFSEKMNKAEASLRIHSGREGNRDCQLRAAICAAEATTSNRSQLPPHMTPAPENGRSESRWR
ncbi:hypothetical protein BKA82DRAFT_11320 [Pisolithus tinctorius]|nr:hypothetical protein BKA82DRAFT_11320 [Pisolithus tinctorius]